MSNKEERLKILINEAREKHLWLFSKYNGVWFSPDELEEQITLGNFVWGINNWELKDPFDKIDKLTKQKTKLNEEIINLRSRIEKKV